MHNVHNEIFDKYFNFGKQVIAINMNGTDFQDRNNGSDQDSDFGFTTNQKDIVEHARLCYLNHPTIVNNIPKESNSYKNTMDDYAKIDNGLAKSQTDIGESSNLAQIAQTYACNFDDVKYQDYVCILSVLAQVAIDNAKRRFDIDLTQEIKNIKTDMDMQTNKYPSFWRIIKRGFKKKNINDSLKCPMNYLYNLDIEKFRNNCSTLPMSYFFIQHPLEKDKKQCRKVEELISNYSLGLLSHQIDDDSDYTEHLLLRSDFDSLIKNIGQTYISQNYAGLMSWLLNRAFVITPRMAEKVPKTNSNLKKNKPLLIKILYQVSRKSFLSCFESDKNRSFEPPLN